MVARHTLIFFIHPSAFVPMGLLRDWHSSSGYPHTRGDSSIVFTISVTFSLRSSKKYIKIDFLIS